MDADQDTLLVQPRLPKQTGKRRNVVIDAQHPLDLEAFVSQYTGRAAIRRLRFVAEECDQLAPQALELALQLILQTRDIGLYQSTLQEYNARVGATHPIQPNTAWLEATAQRNTREKDKLETELKTYASNMIKESIRMGHRDLGNFFWATGDFTQALKHYNKSREFCSSSAHVLEYALTAIRLLLEYNDYSHISTYAYKAEATFAPADGQGKEAKKAPIPAAGSAAAAAAAASATNTERDRAQAKLDLAHAIAHLGTGAYEKAAFAFSRLGKSLEEWFGSVISPSDIAIYGTLCALASMSRSAIKVNFHESDTFSYFLEQEPYTRQLVNAFIENRFKEVLEILDRNSSRHLLDVHLSRHVPALVNEIRKRSLVLYFQPFASVQLEKMGVAFGLNVNDMERLAVELIQEGRIKARVDSTKKVLLAKQVDPRTALYQRAAAAAINTQKTTEKLLLRMRLVQADLIVRAPPRQNNNQQGNNNNAQQGGSQPGQPLQPLSSFAADFYVSGS